TLDDFQMRLQASSAGDRRQQRELLDSVSRPAANSQPSLLDFVQRTAVQTYASSQRLTEVGRNYQPRNAYPASALGNYFKLAAQRLDAGRAARLFYVTHGNFDTHAGQAPVHANLLRDLSDSISAFYRDMAARGQRDRVVIMTFSEF